MVKSPTISPQLLLTLSIKKGVGIRPSTVTLKIKLLLILIERYETSELSKTYQKLFCVSVGSTQRAISPSRVTGHLTGDSFLETWVADRDIVRPKAFFCLWRINSGLNCASYKFLQHTLKLKVGYLQIYLYRHKRMSGVGHWACKIKIAHGRNAGFQYELLTTSSVVSIMNKVRDWSRASNGGSVFKFFFVQSKRLFPCQFSALSKKPIL